MNIIYQLLFLGLTYAIAAIPFGLVLAKIFAKKDIREFGSKNIGATNVARVIGKKTRLCNSDFRWVKRRNYGDYCALHFL